MSLPYAAPPAPVGDTRLPRLWRLRARLPSSAGIEPGRQRERWRHGERRCDRGPDVVRDVLLRAPRLAKVTRHCRKDLAVLGVACVETSGGSVVAAKLDGTVLGIARCKCHSARGPIVSEVHKAHESTASDGGEACALGASAWWHAVRREPDGGSFSNAASSRWTERALGTPEKESAFNPLRELKALCSDLVTPGRIELPSGT